MDITETPIEDIRHIGDKSLYPDGSSPPLVVRATDQAKFNQGDSFGDTDSKLVQSPKALKKMIKAFSRTPFRFEIIFQSTKDVIVNSPGENNNVDFIALNFAAGIHDSYGAVEGKPGVIRVLILSNLSPIESKMPMTPWTVAHKIGHSFQDHEQLTNLPEISSAVSRALDSTDLVPLYRFTMKSARNGKLTNSYERFPEMIAQYLITGKVTIDKTGDNTNDTVFFSGVENNLNRVLDKLFAGIVGKVMVGV